MTRLVVSVLAAAALAGCGSDSEEGQVTDTVTMYLDAFADGDGEATCAQLTGDAYEEVYLAVSAAELAVKLDNPSYVERAPNLEGLSSEDVQQRVEESCPSLIELLLALLREAGAVGGSDLESLHLAEVESVRIDGDRAFVRLEGADAVPTLMKTDGEWKIAKLGIDFRDALP